MKYICLFLLSFAFLFPIEGEAQILKKLKKTAEKAAEDAVLRKTRQKTDEVVTETIDEVLEGEKDAEGEVPSSKEESERVENAESQQSSQAENLEPGGGGAVQIQSEGGDPTESKTPFETYSKYDFTPGEKIISYENFDRVEMGDFPSGWNTMGGAEIVELNSAPGKWIKIGNNTGGLIPYNFTEFPENFTLEFDLVFQTHEDYAFRRSLHMIFTDESDPEKNVNETRVSDNQILFEIYGGLTNHNASLSMKKRKNRQDATGNKVSIASHMSAEKVGQPMQISIWRQKSRMRVYINEQKAYDIPLAWNMESPIKGFRFLTELSREDEFFYVSNMRLAIGKPDTRSKLITEGKLVTYGITFETNSSAVKSNSYGTLKSIAKVLTDNPDVNIQIAGHTDGDGSDDYNLKLSAERAQSVKEILVTQFGIKGDRMTTVGKGESVPIGDNETQEGKAQNRRVELIKQ